MDFGQYEFWEKQDGSVKASLQILVDRLLAEKTRIRRTVCTPALRREPKGWRSRGCLAGPIRFQRPMKDSCRTFSMESRDSKDRTEVLLVLQVQ
jgi:hypothetical protein